MAAEISPPELAALVDAAERPRVDDWSLRAGLVRYAQSEPQRVSDVLDVVRRIDFALRPHLKLLTKRGVDHWAALDGATAGGSGTDVDPLVVSLLGVLQEIDRLGDAVATWAADPTTPKPDEVVDRITSSAARRLDTLGVAREEQRPPRARSRG